MSGSKATAKKSKTYWLALYTWILMFIVNTMGFIDTQTNSSEGMGRSWPFSSGGILPTHWQQAAVIEFAHRAVVFVMMVMLISVAVLAWRKYGAWIEIKILIAITVLAVLAEAALGALAVLFVNPPPVTATHMGIALISFVAVLLMTSIIKRIDVTGGLAQPVALRSNVPDKSFPKWAGFTFGFLLFAIYFGAYVASTGSGGSFQGWPFPTETYAHAKSAFLIDVTHRSIALCVVLLLTLLVVKAYRIRKARPDLLKPCVTALILSGFQALSGALLIYTDLSLVAFLIHVSIVTFIFSTIGYVCMQTLPEPHRAVNRRETSVRGASTVLHA